MMVGKSGLDGFPACHQSKYSLIWYFKYFNKGFTTLFWHKSYNTLYIKHLYKTFKHYQMISYVMKSQSQSKSI